MTRQFMMAAGLALSLSALPVMAQGPGGRVGGPGRGWPGGPLGLLGPLHQLDLTDAQREQLRALAEDGRQGRDGGDSLRDAEEKLHAAVLADKPDLQAIEALKGTVNVAHAAELDHRVELMQKMAQILTPAQRQKLLEAQPPAGGPRGRGRGR